VVTAERDILAPDCRFIIQPDRSLSPRGIGIFFFAVCLLSMAIATGFLLLGAWMVLPYAGLEMLVLGACLYHIARTAGDYEVIAIRADMVEVRKGSLELERSRSSFPRAWSRAILRSHAKGWYPSRLTIGSHGREVEVGRCLNDDEREKLAQGLGEFIVLNRTYHV